MVKKPVFYLDIGSCTGCKTCMVACKDKNNLDAGVRWRRVVEYSGGGWNRMLDGTYSQSIFSYYISVSCNHCDEPICVEGCPTTAMYQDQNGIVSVDQSKCVGCRYCEWACPYSAPQYVPRIGRISKCDFCWEEQSEDNDPACVAACPTRALTMIDRDDSRFQSIKNKAVAPLPITDMTSPNAVFKPTKVCRPNDDVTGFIANKEEIKND